ncbi:MAG: hypothetical protein PHQ47_03930, partial [Candidatus Portnoybacteria bacterium]|nr:hypothetical protein [Candidatus Portnoybacteria bacterium]
KPTPNRLWQRCIFTPDKPTASLKTGRRGKIRNFWNFSHPDYIALSHLLSEDKEGTMIAALNTLFKKSKVYWRMFKFTVLMLFWWYILYIAVGTFLASLYKEFFHPVVAFTLIAWIIVTVMAAWCFSGIVIDSAYLASKLGKKKGDFLDNAIAVIIYMFTSAGMLIAGFPFWEFPKAYSMLILALIGWLVSGHLAKVPFDWKKPRKVYIGLCAVAIGITLCKVLFNWYAEEPLTWAIIRNAIRDPSCALIGKGAVFALLIFGAGIIFKSKRVKTLGAVMLVAAFGCWLFSNFIPLEKSNVSPTPSPAPAVVWESHEPVYVPANAKEVPTGVRTRGEPILLCQDGPPKTYYIQCVDEKRIPYKIKVNSTEWPTHWDNADPADPPEIKLSGGPIATYVTIKQKKVVMTSK